MLPNTVPMQWLLKPGVAAPQGPSLQQRLMGLAFEAGIRCRGNGTGNVGIKNKKTNNGCRNVWGYMVINQPKWDFTLYRTYGK